MSFLLACSGTAMAGHPQTVWDSAELARLQAARTTTHAELANTLKVYLNQFAGSGLGSNVAPYAMAARIWEQDSYKSTAVAKLMAHCNSGWANDLDILQAYDLLNGSVGYDVLYDLLSPAQRDACRNRIASSAAGLAQEANRGVWWVHDMVQNHNWVNFAAIGIAGQALEGEHSSAESWRALADANHQKIKAIQDLVIDGSWHEGIGYMEFGIERTIAYDFGAARRGSSADKSHMLRGLGRYILSVQQPNHPRVHVMTHGDWNWSRPGLMVCLRWAARRFGDPLAQEAARRWDLEPRLMRAAFGLSYALEYIAYDPGVALPNMSVVPLDFYAGDQQASILRSSWDWGSQAKGVVLGFKSGVFGGRGNFERMRTGGFPGGGLNFSHSHEDDLGLWIYGNGGWLLPEAVAYNCCYGTSQYHSTSWQNSFLFDGQGQLGDNKQPGLSYKSFGDGHPWFFQREASMPLHASTEHYAFARGEGPRLYPSSLGVQTLARTVALSRSPAYLALHDRVGLGAARTIEQLFHSQEQASNAAPWLKLVNQNDTVLGIRVVSPTQYLANISTQQSNMYQEDMDNDGAFRLVKLAPTSPRSGLSFLEVLWPSTNASWAARPNVQPLDAAAPHRGFLVPLEGATESWIYSDSATTSAGDLTLSMGTGQEIGIRRVSSGGELQSLVLQGQGSLLDQAGARTLIDLGQSRGALEVSFTGNRADLSGTADLDGVRFFGPDVTAVHARGIPVGWKRAGAMVAIDLSVPVAGAGGDDTTAPTITGAAIEERTHAQVTVAWQTDEPADSQIEFGESPAYGSATPLDRQWVTDHRQVISGLRAAGKYHLRVKSRDAAGNEASDELVVTLLAAGPGSPAPVATYAEGSTPEKRGFHCAAAGSGALGGASGLVLLSLLSAARSRRPKPR